MSAEPTPLMTIRAVVRGYLPRLFQARGWSLAAVTLLPLGLLTVILFSMRGKVDVDPQAGIKAFHLVFVPFLLPILALIAAPAGIREDIEQRTLPLMLVRPAKVWLLPFAKGLLWFAWGGVWLAVASLLMVPLGVEVADLPRLGLALLIAYWAQLAFMAMLTLHFKRGVLWGAVFCFVWDPLVRIMPGDLQRFTFLHYIESIAQSRGGGVQPIQLLAQEQISTSPWLAVIVLMAFGALCWFVAGQKLQRTPIGLAGRESEG